MEEEQDFTDRFMEGAKVKEDLLGMWLTVCDTDDCLVAELRVLGLYGKKQGWISGEWKLEAQNKAFEDDVMKQWGMLEEFKVQSEMTGVKGKEHYLRNLRGVERIKKSLKGKGGQKEGLLWHATWKYISILFSETNYLRA